MCVSINLLFAQYNHRECPFFKNHKYSKSYFVFLDPGLVQETESRSSGLQRSSREHWFYPEHSVPTETNFCQVEFIFLTLPGLYCGIIYTAVLVKCIQVLRTSTTSIFTVGPKA